MVIALICAVFVLGYLAIALEHKIHINKAAPAVFAGVICWTLYVVNSSQFPNSQESLDWFGSNPATVAEGGHGDLNSAYIREHLLAHNVYEIASILFFLMGAMTIVEILDAFGAFSIITERIKSTSRVKLLWLVSFMTFFLSSVLDNLTTTIVMISLVKKLIGDHKTRLFFAGMIVCAANAGGAWTVIGDVTTTMLWIKNKITVVPVMKVLILPSLICMLVPLALVSLRMKGNVEHPEETNGGHNSKVPRYWQYILLIVGVAGLVSVPIFKTVTHMPPFMGILLSMSVVWILAEIVRQDLEDEFVKSSTHILEILKRVDTSTILFFLGILLAVGSLSQAGILGHMATWLDSTVGNRDIIAVLIGLLSAVVDNVPLVAAGIEMYKLPTDDPFWMFLAYTAGTGGSCLIIGSAAGVAAMGLERINFIWYMLSITPLALLGYFSGCATYYAIEHWFNLI
jgi:Na+/H+ antiporter NhaD/arsenite permease-like protein